MSINKSLLSVSCYRLQFIFVIVLFLAVYADPSKADHLDELNCSECHLFDAPKQNNSQYLVDTQEQICLSCHAGLEFSSHPVDFKTNETMPPEFPLAHSDVFSCSTCHEIHSSELHGKMRVNLEMDFCALCHEDPFFSQMTEHGQYFDNRVHLIPSPVYEPIDSYSLACLDCHADKFELEGTNKRHSIGKDYRSSKGLSDLQQLDLLPFEFALPDGQMSCITCHESYSAHHGELVWELSESALCMQCHRM